MNKMQSTTSEVVTISSQLLLIRRSGDPDLFLARRERAILAFSADADGAIVYHVHYGRLYQTTAAANRAWPRLITTVITKRNHGIFSIDDKSWITTVHTFKAVGDKHYRYHYFQSSQNVVNTFFAVAEDYYAKYLQWLQK